MAFFPEYETAAEARRADAIRDAEVWARSKGIKLECVYASGDACHWTLTFDAYPEQVGCELQDIGRRMRG